MRLKILLALMITATAAAFAVAPNVGQNGVNPAGAQRGTEVEVKLSGDRLADAQEVFFYEKGIECVKIVQATNSSVTALFKISPDCRLGEHNLRVRTAGGISALRIFYVGALPNVEEKETAREPNNDPAHAQKIPLNCTVNGRIETEDVDYFEVEAKKGQRLSAEVEGARLGRTMFDPYVAIHDAKGVVLAEDDDTALATQDSFLSLIAPEDGKYFIELRDSSYSGAGHHYRLHVGTFPRPQAVYPVGGRMGEVVDAKFIGDAAGDFTQKLKLPAKPMAKFSALAEHDGLAPSPDWMRVSPFSNVLEVEPNDTTTNATVAPGAWPVAFNGIISKKGDVDFFRFTAKKDDSLDVQVWARRLGSPLDSLLQVLNSKGSVMSSADDSNGSADSAVRVRIPADGDYYVKVTDHQGRGGPAFTYRVEVTEPTPLVTLSIPDTARYDNETRKSIVVPRGNRFAIQLNALRADFNGALDYKFAGLPNGVTYHTDTLSNGVATQVVVFEAADDAPVGGNLLTPVAKSTDPVKPVESQFRHRVEWVRIQNATVYSLSDAHQIAAVVTEEVPFKVRIVPPKVAIVQNGTLDLKIEAERQDGFDEPITVKMIWNPSGLGSLPDMVIPKGTNSVMYRVTANGGAETRVWKIAVTASATVKGGPAYVSSQLMPLEVAKPFVEGKLDIASVERGKTTRVVCKLNQKIPFEGKASIKLVGLPANATTKDLEITKDTTEAVFEIETTEKAQPGVTKNLFCSVVVTQHGEPVTHTIASGGIFRVDAPRVKLAGTTTSAVKK
ncbi:MAG: PPC domain-containing protein [Verrucomicrobia bacterium]|nr:PPC domain-containing protein [Verrucomicrobiota bacterium]